VLRRSPMETAPDEMNGDANLPIALWASLDTNIGIIVVCLPSLRPYLHTSAPPSEFYENSSIRASQGRKGGWRQRGDNRSLSASQSERASNSASRAWDAALEEGFDENPSMISRSDNSRQGEDIGSEIELNTCSRGNWASLLVILS